MVAARIRASFIFCYFMALVVVVYSNESCNLEFERTLFNLFSPQEPPTSQIRTFRRHLLRMLQNMLIRTEEIEGWNAYVYPKRNLEALARAGYLRTAPNDDNQTEVQDKDKKSYASLAKNGQLPIRTRSEEDSNKRSVEPPPQLSDIEMEIQRMLEEIYDNTPNSRDVYQKRNIASIARDGGFNGKRNVASLLRNDRYLNYLMQHHNDNIDSMRGIYSLKDSNDGYPKHNDDSSNVLSENAMENEQHTSKRFLGRLPQMGKTKTTSSPET